jgi:uncharacterized protein with FMN-binding domain
MESAMFPRRAIVAVVTTAIALVLLFSFRIPADAGTAASTAGLAVAVGQPTAQTPAGSRLAASSGAGSGGGAVPSSAAPPGSAAAGATGTATGTFTGSVVSTRFGNVQVQVTLNGGTIVDIQAIQLPSGDPHSSQISDRVAPILRSAALQVQSAAIDLVSGATYTSEAYARSLQSALDQARG